AGHVFEGWFGSHEDYDAQRERGLIRCPVCDSSTVARQVSASRLNVSSSRSDPPPPPQPDLGRLQAEVLRHMREALRRADNVGSRFAEEARRMHEGQAPERPIRGTASIE